MRINERDVCRRFEPTEAQVIHAQNMINQWEIVIKTMKSPGWQLLIDFFRSQLQLYDSMSNMDKSAELGDLLYRMGVVDGLNALLQSPERLKQSATSAAKFLKEAELAEKKE